MYGAAQSACEVVLFEMFIGSSLIFARAYDRYVNGGGKMKQLRTGVHPVKCGLILNKQEPSESFHKKVALNIGSKTGFNSNIIQIQ